MFNGIHEGWMWGMHGLWWVFWILITVAFVWILSRAGGSTQGVVRSGPRESPLEVLERRYAEGALSTEEYEERRERLERDR